MSVDGLKMDNTLQLNAVDEFVQAQFGSDWKRVGGNDSERLYHCKWHDDKHKSCSVNIEKRVYNCHGCGAKGSFYQLGKSTNWENPHLLIPNNQNSAIVTNGSLPSKSRAKKIKKPLKTFTMKELADMQKENVNRLKNNMMEYWDGYLWDEDLIDLLDIGVCRHGNWEISIHNRDGDIIAVKTHKYDGVRCKFIGDGSARWYAQHLIYDYDYDKDWTLGEGEIDFWTAFSRNGQVFTGTCGAKNIPKNRDGNNDLSPFKYFTNNANGYIAYDNDVTGRDCGLIIGTEILKEYPSHNIFQAQWGDDCADKFDITDAYNESPKDGIKYMEAIMNAKRIKLPKIKYDSFVILKDTDADVKPIKESVEIVEHILVQDSFSIFGGTAGCNKSMFCMQVGMALANDENEVMGFKIGVKGLTVLYVDTECGVEEMNRRYNKLKKNFRNWKSTGRFIMMSRKSKIISEALDDIDKAIQQEKPNVVYYDCLYNMGDGKDLAKNHHLSPITGRIKDSSMIFKFTPVVIAHATKGNHEQGLKMDRIAGGSHLQNCAEHIVLFTRTNEEALRMLRIDKSRSTGFPTCYYGLEWNGEKFFMEDREVIPNPKTYLISEQKMEMWNTYLVQMKDTFTTKDWLNEVEIIGGKSYRTAMRYLREMVISGVLSKHHTGDGIYTKNIKVREDDNNEE